MKILLILLILLLPQEDLLIPSFPTIPTASISQPFGNLKHVGIDFNVPTGTEVYADLDGIVIQELTTGVYGRLLMIEHPDGYVSLYAHLSEFKVDKYEQVTSGQLIALSGGDPSDKDSGSSSGAHLHWEVRPRGHTSTNLYNVDPMKYLMSYIYVDYKLAIVNSSEGLNVRNNPSKNSIIIYSLYNRDIVRVVEINRNWARLDSLRPEWVLLKYLEFK